MATSDTAFFRDIAPLAIGGAALFLIAKTGLLQKIGKGAGEAAQGLGSGIAEGGRAAGDVVRDVERFVYSVGRGGERVIRYGGNVVYSASETAQDILRETGDIATAVGNEGEAIIRAPRQIFNRVFNPSVQEGRARRQGAIKIISAPFKKVQATTTESRNQNREKLAAAKKAVTGAASKAKSFVQKIAKKVTSRSKKRGR